MNQPNEVSERKTKSRPPELFMTRVFNAPRRLVFEAWTKKEYVARWFTPAPLTASQCEFDFRPGGVFRLVMRMPNGFEHPMDASFGEIVPLEKVVFDAKLADGNVIHTVVTFEDEGERTKLTVHQTYAFESDATRGAHAGWTATLNQLEKVASELGR